MLNDVKHLQCNAMSCFTPFSIFMALHCSIS
jgi:hypothetical protein